MMGLAYIIITLSSMGPLFFTNRSVLLCSFMVFCFFANISVAVSPQDELFLESKHYREAVAIMIMAVMAYF